MGFQKQQCDNKKGHGIFRDLKKFKDIPDFQNLACKIIN
jgi:hypothetical protein